MANITD